MSGADIMITLWEQGAGTVQQQTASSIASVDLSGLVALVLVALVVVLVVQSIQTHADTGLVVLLGVIALAYAAGIAGSAALVADPTDFLRTHPWAGVGVAFDLDAGLFLFSFSGLATLVTAARARRWAWRAISGAALLPLMALALLGGVPTDSLSYAANIVPFAATLVCPILVGMAFALSQRPGQHLAA